MKKFIFAFKNVLHSGLKMFQDSLFLMFRSFRFYFHKISFLCLKISFLIVRRIFRILVGIFCCHVILAELVACIWTIIKSNKGTNLILTVFFKKLTPSILIKITLKMDFVLSQSLFGNYYIETEMHFIIIIIIKKTYVSSFFRLLSSNTYIYIFIKIL